MTRRARRPAANRASVAQRHGHSRTPLTRPEIMSRVRRRDTKPELLIRERLWKVRRGYRVDFWDTSTHIDIAFTRARVAVFLDGCFWHCCPDHGTRPRTNKEYWLPKLRRNKARDREQGEALAAKGWTVLRFWEHECVADPDRVVDRIAESLPAYGEKTVRRPGLDKPRP